MELYREAKPLEICDGAELYVKFLVPIDITVENLSIEIKNALFKIEGPHGTEYEGTDKLIMDAAKAILSKLSGE